MNALRHIIRRMSESNQQCTPGPSATAGGKIGGYKIWKRLSFFVAFPAVGVCLVHTYLKHKEDHENYKRPEFIKYEYLYIRNKRFPWGDGVKSYFHNPRINALPDGYEDSDDEH